LFLLVELEALLVAVVSILLGASMLYMSLSIVGDVLVSNFGLHISTNIVSKSNVLVLFWVICSTVIVAAIPSLGAYKSARSRQME